MLNIEKYKEEILKEYNKRLENTDEGRYSEQLANAIFDVFCCDKYKREKNVAEWAFREYEGSILSQEGKDFLKQLIAPFSLTQVINVNIDREFYYLRVNFVEGHIDFPRGVFEKKWGLFAHLDPDVLYTLEELEL